MTRPRPRPDGPTGLPGGEADVRVVWHPGSGDELVGTCRCGARFCSPDPRAVWNWYAAHDHASAPSSGEGPP